MKIKILAMVLITGFIGMSSVADFNQFSDPLGYLNLFGVNPDDTRGGYVTGYPYGLPDLKAVNDSGDDRTFVLSPNTKGYADNANSTNPVDVVYWTNSDDLGENPGPDGNKFLEQASYWEIFPMVSVYTNTSFTFTVDANDISNRYEVIGFVKVLDPGSGWGVADGGTQIDTVTITTAGTYTVSIDMYEFNVGMSLQAGWQLNGRNANPADDWGSVAVTAIELNASDSDFTPPSPSPMTFAVAPYAISDSAISMTATTAIDTNNAVEYLFSNSVTTVTSGWQSDTNWTDTGLTAGQTYGYYVKARDTSSQQNDTLWSTPVAEATTTDSDDTPPEPNPMTFDDTEASPQSVKLTATTAIDDLSAVEYFFDCVDGDAQDSEWQSSPIYINTGLVYGSNYTFTVTARDLSAAMNTTTASAPVVVTTLAYPGSFAMSNSLQEYTGDSNQDGTVHEVLKDNLEFADYLLGRRIAFDTEGAVFGSFSGGDDGRNVIRTMGMDYSDSSFEAYVTASGMDVDENIFIGLGPGDMGAYGVPDWSPNGETTNASFAEIWSQTNNSTGNWGTDVNVGHTITTGTVQRIRLAFDFSTQEGTITLDLDYDGVTFDEDSVIGPISIPDFSVSASRIYLGGDDGIILSDFEIVGAAAPVIPPADLVISAGSGSVQLMWTGVAGQTYNVEYKNDLTDPTWTADTTAGTDIPGEVNMSATSTAPGDAVFYQIKSE